MTSEWSLKRCDRVGQGKWWEGRNPKRGKGMRMSRKNEKASVPRHHWSTARGHQLCKMGPQSTDRSQRHRSLNLCSDFSHITGVMGVRRSFHFQHLRQNVPWFGTGSESYENREEGRFVISEANSHPWVSYSGFLLLWRNNMSKIQVEEERAYLAYTFILLFHHQRKSA